jgi:protein ImuA
MLAARMEGPVVWVHQSWRGVRLHADGIAPLFNPGRLLLVDASREEDLLWSMEEALRSGAAPLVVADLAATLPLTPVRRLHLAAEAGATEAAAPPLGLLLTPGDGGCQGVESRWSMRPTPGWAGEGPARWQLSRLRSRLEPPREWGLVRNKRQLVAPGDAEDRSDEVPVAPRPVRLAGGANRRPRGEQPKAASQSGRA